MREHRISTSELRLPTDGPWRSILPAESVAVFLAFNRSVIPPSDKFAAMTVMIRNLHAADQVSGTLA
jgi:hypothetical protein